MRRRTPTPSAAIVTGIGMIAFALFYSYMGIFPNRTLGHPSRVVLLKEEPAKFRWAVALTLVMGGGILTWGLLQRRKR